MADDFTGTNTERIDKLIVAIVELRTEVRTTMRLLSAVVIVCLPLIVALMTNIVTRLSGIESRVDRLGDRIDRVEKLERPAKP